MTDIPKNVLVWDIETDSTDVDKANLKFFGYYSYRNNKRGYITYENPEKIQEILDLHQTWVGYNLKEYDIPIMDRMGFRTNEALVIDLYEILQDRFKGGKGRAALLGESFSDMSLRNVIETLDLDNQMEKGEIDYAIFEQDSWTEEELQKIVEYLKGDIVTTRNLFEYLHSFFYSFREYLTDEQNQRYEWLTTSAGAYAYKAICNLCDLSEEYNDHEDTEYMGGHVFEPLKKTNDKPTYIIDFSSLYPHMYMMGNLFSPECDCCVPGFKNDGIFSLENGYCREKQGKIEQQIKKLYKRRQEYKQQNDEREYALKIILNSLYGINSSVVFDSVYYPNSAPDCTRMGRSCIKYAKKQMQEAEHTVLGGDTDSLFVETNDKEDMLETKKEITEGIKEMVPFPQDTFGMDVDAEIKKIWFFREDDNSGFKKKHYIYITQNNKITIKGLPIIKGNATRLSKKIYEDYLKERIIERTDIHFEKEYIKKLIKQELKKDPRLASTAYNVGYLDNYKSETSLYYRIAEKYGEGETHYLIPNDKKGVGSAKKYYKIDENATPQEIWDNLRENGIYFRNILTDKIMNELEPFIEDNQKSLATF